MSQLWLSTRFHPLGMPPLPAWLTIAHIRPCCLMVGKSAGPISSTECSPIRFAFAASSSRDMSLKHQRQTDCLIALAAPRAGITALSRADRCAAPCAAPPEAHALTLPNPASAPPTIALRCMNSRRLGIRLSREGWRRVKERRNADLDGDLAEKAGLPALRVEMLGPEQRSFPSTT